MKLQTTVCICLLLAGLSQSAYLNRQKKVLRRLLPLSWVKRLEKRVPDSCTPEYEALGHSTMCEYEDDPAATNPGVSDADKEVILAEHNNYRANTSPSATDMQKIYYDEDIAKIAQKWALHCPDLSHAHDTADNRLVPGWGILVGQNYAYGYDDWPAAIKVWYDEFNDFVYAQPAEFYYDKVITHYTQVVTAVASRMGCGFADCPHGPTYVCNYAFGNPFDLGHPYAEGERCAECPDQCSDNLCDCKGKLCRNGGTLKIDTCTCECDAIHQGDTCDEVKCPPRDEDYCGEPQPYGYTETECEWENVPLECPFMCGVCTGEQEEAPEGEEGGDGECEDHPDCGNEEYGYIEENCEVYEEVKEFCPQLCGTC